MPKRERNGQSQFPEFKINEDGSRVGKIVFENASPGSHFQRLFQCGGQPETVVFATCLDESNEWRCFSINVLTPRR